MVLRFRYAVCRFHGPRRTAHSRRYLNSEFPMTATPEDSEFPMTATPEEYIVGLDYDAVRRYDQL